MPEFRRGLRMRGPLAGAAAAGLVAVTAGGCAATAAAGPAATGTPAAATAGAPAPHAPRRQGAPCRRNGGDAGRLRLIASSVHHRDQGSTAVGRGDTHKIRAR